MAVSGQCYLAVLRYTKNAHNLIKCGKGHVSVGSRGRSILTSWKLELPTLLHSIGAPQRNGVRRGWRSCRRPGAVSKRPADAPEVCEARQQAALQDCHVPIQPQPCSDFAFVARALDGVGAAQRRNTNPGRCGLPEKKGQRRKPYPSTPCWSCLPRFLRTGSRPRDYVSSGGHGRWCAS